jgi:hypothetical protein
LEKQKEKLLNYKEKNMKFNTRELVTLAVFGVLWGVVEISLGSVLKSLNIPLSGVVLSTIGLTVAMVGRVFVPRRGSTLFIGILACILKLFSLGGVIIGPMIGILSEAVIAELALSLSGKPRRMSFIISGALGVLWCLVQPFITNPLIFGRSIFMAWLDMLDMGARLLGISQDTVWLIVLILAAIHIAIGVVAGLFAWEVGQRLQVRVNRNQIETNQI